jgi:hypothetical protein
MLFLFSIVSTPAHAWLDGYNMRMKLDITNTPLYDYEEDFNVNFVTGMRNNFGDVNFTDSSDASLAEYLNSKVNGTYANFTVRVPVGSTYVYIYFNSPNNPVMNDRSAVFTMWDSIESTPSGWNAAYGTPVISNSTDYAHSGSYSLKFTDDSGNTHLAKNSTIDNGCGMIVDYWALSTVGEHEEYKGIGNDVMQQSLFFLEPWSSNHTYYLNSSSLSWSDSGITASTGTWYHYRFWVNESCHLAKFAFDDWYMDDPSTLPSSPINQNNSGAYIVEKSTATMFIDDVTYRRYQQVEPTYSAESAEGCVVPYDDTVITSNTTLCEGTYYINDTSNDGILLINASNITLDCNNSLFIGDNTGTFINILTGVNGLSIINCGITNYTYSVYGGYYDNAGEIGARVWNFINNTVTNAPYSFFMGKVGGGSSYFSYNHIYDTYCSPYGQFCGLWGSWDTWNRDNTTISYNYFNNSNFVVGCPRSYVGSPYFQDYAGCIVDNNEIYNSVSGGVMFVRKSWGYGYAYGATFNNNIIRNTSGCGFYVFPNAYSYFTHIFASGNNTMIDNGCGVGTDNYGNPVIWDGLYNSTIINNSGTDFSLYRGTLHLVNVTTDDIYVYGAAAVYRDWYGYSLNVYGWNGTIAGANVYLYGAAWNESLGSTDSQGNTTFSGVLPQYYINSTGRYNSSVSASKSGWKSNSMGASMVANNVHESMKLKMFAEPELYLNGADDDAYITFADTLNVTSVVNGGLGSQSGLILMFNGTPISNPNIGTHVGGLYNYTAAFSENADFASLVGSATHFAWVDICSSGICRVIREVGGGISGLFTAISNPLAYIMLILGIVAGALVVFYGVVTIIVRLI